MFFAIALYLTAINVAAFIVYGVDKSRAKRQARRIPERILLVLAFLGGAVGALAGMLVFRHKIRKPRFFVCVPIALALTLVVGGGALYVSDYYPADDTALAAVQAEPAEDGVQVLQLEGGALAFVPANASAGLVFYPGAKVQPEAYAPLLRACAEQGVLCVLVKPLFNLAIIDVSAADGIIGQFPEVPCWIVSGHSLGGVAAAQFLASHQDDFAGIAFLASRPTVDLSAYSGSALSLIASNDGVLNFKEYEASRANLPADFFEYMIEGGNHSYYGNYGDQPNDGQATISREDQQAQAVQQIAAFAAGLAA